MMHIWRKRYIDEFPEIKETTKKSGQDVFLFDESELFNWVKFRRHTGRGTMYVVQEPPPSKLDIGLVQTFLFGKQSWVSKSKKAQGDLIDLYPDE